MILTCSFCRLSYCPDKPEDKRQHNKRHKRYEKVLASGYDLLTEEEEAERLLYADTYTQSENLKHQVLGWKSRLEYYFNRSFRASINRNDWLKHPDYLDYMAMVNQTFPGIPAEVRQELKKQYGERANEIEPGNSYWMPAGK